jgi:hypothetical protein
VDEPVNALSVNENDFLAFSFLIGTGEFGCLQIPMGDVEGKACYNSKLWMNSVSVVDDYQLS